VTGVNNNAYQVQRSNILCEKAGLSHLSKAVKGDFMNLPFPAESFDACYAIEATCHAPDRVGCFSQMFKVLKEGGVFAGYEWVMTPKYDPKNESHRRGERARSAALLALGMANGSPLCCAVKHQVEHGNGLPDLATAEDVVAALRKAGFEVEEHFDLAVTAPLDGNQITWFASLQGGCSLAQFKHTRAGRRFTQTMVDVMETLRLAPKGTSKTHQMLCDGADGLAAGGEWGIFTPMYFFVARKPVKSQKARSQQ
jgi:sterol 24-C-methyltransferase